MEYCQQCILPDTRPNLELDSERICNACRSHEEKDEIDWENRRDAFTHVAEYAKERSTGYDCLIPVSGGKDSYWQVVTCLEHGLKPLAVTWKTPTRTPVGQWNLEKLVESGIDHIDYQIDPEIERVFVRKSFETVGSPAVPMHIAIFNITLKIANLFEIPLVVWGENSASEYGSAEERHRGHELTEEWYETYGVTHGTRAGDWVDEDLSESDLTPYFGPDPTDLEENGIRAVFLGYYFRYDPRHSFEVARRHGFGRREQGPLTGYHDYASIDDYIHPIHHWLKWYKFGFTKSWDDLSLDIRNDRLTRGEAIDLLREEDDVTPELCIHKFCKFTNINRVEFNNIAEQWRNEDVWNRVNGRWLIDEFLIEDYDWA